jgi:cytochrome P450 family 4 subfamily V
MDILLKTKHENPDISFEDIQEEVDTFMFEGHDTTAAAASWACHLIGSHPDIQKKLHIEIDRVMGT